MMPETIGQRLQNARTTRRLTLEQAAQVTRIRVPYLQALERDDFTAMPSPVQGRGFLRLYAQYLGLDIETMLAEMRQSAMQEADNAELVRPETEMQLDGPAVGEVVVGETTSFWTRQLERLKAVRNRALAGSSAIEAGSQPGAETLPQADADQFEAETLPEIPAEQAEVQEEPGDEAVVPSDENVPERQPFWQAWLAGGRALLARRKKPAEEESETLQEEISSRQSAQEIFTEIGTQLRARRELLSLTLDEVEQHTRVRPHFLKALESGEIEALPSPVQTRGMLNNYAAFLDVDAEKLLLRFAEGLQAQRRERQPERVVSPRRPGRFALFKSFAAGDMIFGIGMAVGLLVFVIWAAGRILKTQPEVDVEPQAPSISDVLLASPVEGDATLEPTPTLVLEGVAAPQETATPAAGDTGNIPIQPALVQVTVSVVERTWMRVLVDGEVEFEGRVMPGSAYPFSGQQQVEVLTGNGSALQIMHNQKNLGRMGNFGEVVQRIYLIDNVLVPTATVSPTPTVTPPPTSTPVPSRTPLATPNMLDE